jgi:membrane-bound lytic murein transglycosylase A
MDNGVGFQGGRRMTRLNTLIFIILSLAIFTGCHKKNPPDYNKELPSGMVALRKIPLSDYPDFSQSTWNIDKVIQAVDQSIIYLQRPSAQTRGYPYLDIDHSRALATCNAFKAMLRQAKSQPNPGDYINQQIRANYEVYKSWGAPESEGSGFTDTVLFTGYCTPIYEASKTQEGEFIWPLYKKPENLVLDPVTGETAAPWKTRREIESGAMAGKELVYLKSRWEAYVVTVQGSARLKLRDGAIYEVGFAGQNGYEYTSPGLAMINDKLLEKSELSLKKLGEIFSKNPSLMDKYLWKNDRTVFFTERPGGPFGAINVPVTDLATIATDKTVDKVSGMSVYPRAIPAFLNVSLPDSRDPANKSFPFSGFMMDQDTGGAIRAAGRCDIYMGVGPQGEAMAGHQFSEGQLYYIAIKPQFVNQFLNH